jgi:uncharacterized protein YukE
MPNGGYTTSSEAMMRAQTRLQEAAEEPASEAKKVSPTQLSQENFGKAHGDYFSRFQSGMDEIGAAMTGLSGELAALGGSIGSAGNMYTTAEGDAAATSTDAGSGV